MNFVHTGHIGSGDVSNQNTSESVGFYSVVMNCSFFCDCHHSSVGKCRLHFLLVSTTVYAEWDLLI